MITCGANTNQAIPMAVITATATTIPAILSFKHDAFTHDSNKRLKSR